MSSPALLLNSAVPAVPMNSPTAPSAEATGVGAAPGPAAGALTLGGPAIGEAATGGAGNTGPAFLTSFLQVMQQTAKGLPTPGAVALPENPLPEIPLESSLAVPIGGSLAGLMTEALSQELSPDLSDGESVLAEQLALAASDIAESVEIPGSDQGECEVMEFDSLAIPAGDVIPTDLPDLPPFAAQEVINPTPREALAESAELPSVLIPTPQGAPLADSLTAPEAGDNGRRLDLTQWLSRANPLAADAGLSDEPATVVTGAAAPLVENSDALLKNALFARALPAAESSMLFAAGDLVTAEELVAAGELDSSSPIPAASARSAVAPAPAPWMVETVNSGRITVPLNLSFGHPQWSEALAERAGWLAHQRIHSADVQLDPPELGPLQVKISVHQDQAVVSFVSANPQVRDLLDQNLTRLRDMLQEQGLQLVDAGVSDQRQDSGDHTRAAAGDAADTGESAPALSAEAETNTQVAATWGVDDFV